MNTGRSEIGSKNPGRRPFCSAVSSEGLAHEVHGDDQEAMDCVPPPPTKEDGGQSRTNRGEEEEEQSEDSV
jgi:hypothetical protein